jgi:hypothetical protein
MRLAGLPGGENSDWALALLGSSLSAFCRTNRPMIFRRAMLANEKFDMAHDYRASDKFVAR